MLKKKCVVIGVTGGIAAYKAAEIVSSLRERGIRVRVVMTDEAHYFITPLTLQALSGEKVCSDMFKTQTEDWDIEHISVAESADLVLIAPATANIIGKIANGICDDLLSCVVAATKAPVLFSPAMNDAMYANKCVQENIVKLKKFGYKFIGPEKGRLACGKSGLGRMSEPEDIVKTVLSFLK